jgi:colanic acid/amylovoran biosynthesis glycosyltransferase
VSLRNSPVRDAQAPRDMRIAYYTTCYPRATDTFIQREVLGLRQRGIDVRTFAVRRSGADHDISSEVVDEKRNTFYALPIGPLKVIAANLSTLMRAPRRYVAALALALSTRRPGLPGLALQLAYFQEAVVLAREMRRQGITHVHNHGGDNSGTVTLLVSALLGIGFSITIHGPYIFFDPTHWALREKVRKARFIACISHYALSQMMLFSDKSDWFRLRIIHCGVDITRFRYQDIRPQVRKLLYTGRLEVEKGLPVLFESVRLLLAQGYEFELTLVGNGCDRQALEQLGRDLGISASLVFAGYASQDGVRAHLERSDIFVLPSFAEGVPVSLMEAMACGVPVLATYVGGIAELVEPERTGLLVPPADSRRLSEGIARYIDDFDLRKRVSRLARARVETEFNLETEVGALADLFLANASVDTDAR